MDSSSQVNSINNPGLLQQSALRLPDLMPQSSRDNVSIFNRTLVCTLAPAAPVLIGREEGQSVNVSSGSTGICASRHASDVCVNMQLLINSLNKLGQVLRIKLAVQQSVDRELLVWVELIRQRTRGKSSVGGKEEKAQRICNFYLEFGLSLRMSFLQQAQFITRLIRAVVSVNNVRGFIKVTNY